MIMSDLQYISNEALVTIRDSIAVLEEQLKEERKGKSRLIRAKLNRELADVEVTIIQVADELIERMLAGKIEFDGTTFIK